MTIPTGNTLRTAIDTLLDHMGMTEPLRYPESDESRPADWVALRDEAEGEPEVYSFADVATYTTDDQTFQVVVDDHEVVGLLVDGELRYAPDLRDHELPDEDDAVGVAEAERVQHYLDVVEAANSDVVADGPMMAYWYPLYRDSYDPRDMAEIAAKLADSPLCAVHVDGTYGLALTGGGMSFAWEIAEAFLKVGYWPPLFLDLPQMADRGHSRRDQQIVMALSLRNATEAANRADSAQRLLERYPRPPIKIQPELRADGVLPYPFLIHADGTVGAQKLWNGNPSKLVGFTPTVEGSSLTVDLAAFVADPSKALGLLPVMENAEGRWQVYTPAIDHVQAYPGDELVKRT